MLNSNPPQTKAKHQGFTMIELLIVLSIMATLMGLVGPLTVNSLNKYQAKVEMVEVKSLVSRYSNLAFLKGEAIQLVFRGHKVTREIDDELIDEFTFDSLSFYPTTLSFNQSGIPDITEIKLLVSEKETNIDLLGIIYD